LGPTVGRILVNCGSDRQCAEFVRSFGRVRRPFLELGDALFLQLTSLAPIGRTERLAVPLAMHNDIEPVLFAALPEDHFESLKHR
jgi:hypothetical protein